MNSMYKSIGIPGIGNLVPTFMHENGSAVTLTKVAQLLRVLRIQLVIGAPDMDGGDHDGGGAIARVVIGRMAGEEDCTSEGRQR